MYLCLLADPECCFVIPRTTGPGRATPAVLPRRVELCLVMCSLLLRHRAFGYAQSVRTMHITPQGFTARLKKYVK